MQLVLVGVAAVGTALLVLLIAYALTVLVMAILEGLAHNVPVIGGYIARGARPAVEWAQRKIVAYANAGVHMVAGWFGGLADLHRDFAEAVNAYLVELPDRLDHLLHVSVHNVVKAFVNPVRDTATYARDTADSAIVGVTDVYTHPLADFKGIEHGVRDLVDRARAGIKNVDLPELHDVVGREIDRATDFVRGETVELGELVNEELSRLWDQLGRIPLQQLLEGLALATGTAALVDVIAREGGLGRAECRSKVKAICSTDPAAWQALLDVAGLVAVWEGLPWFVEEARALYRETAGLLAELARSG